MNTTVINVQKAIEDGHYIWKQGSNDTEFRGYIPGYYMGFCVEGVRADGKVGYASCTFVDGDFEEIREPEMVAPMTWNELGLSAEMIRLNGYVPTGRIVFRGYYNMHYDFDEREEYFTEASKDVERIWSEYVLEGVNA